MSFSRQILIQLVLAVTLGMLSLNTFAVYKWKDKDGNIQYTEYPPPTGEVEILKPPPISTVGAQKSDQPATSETDKKDSAKQSKEDPKAPPVDPKAEQAMKEKNCDIAKKNLATYMRTKKIRDKEGNVVRLDDDDWQRRVEETKKNIEKYCN